tara:strand:- start:2814 stop:3320 length:507 start_codon:yes stop_codon:yes gene_type:complete
MFHWEIKDFGKQSSITSKAFEVGEKILCTVLKDTKSNEMIRFDLLESEYPEWEQAEDKLILGKWVRVYSEETKALSQEERKHSAESFFFSLFDSNENSSEKDEMSLLKYLFAVSLERKRVLKSKPIKGEADFQIFIHIKTKRELSVPVVIPDLETVSKVESVIGDLLL